MQVALAGLNLLFGRGDDDFPVWLLAVRLNIIAFVAALALAGWREWRARRAHAFSWTPQLAAILAITGVAALLRGLASANLFDFGGIPYSRMLYGYRGVFAAAQFYSPLYELTGRSIENAILFNRIAGISTVPLMYLLCRRLRPESRWFPVVAAFLMAVYPLHVAFSASNALAIFAVFLATASYWLLARATDATDRDARILYLAAGSGLSLLTQVRYESAILLIPPAVYLIGRRRALVPSLLLPGLSLGLAFGIIYAYGLLAWGVPYRPPVEVEQNVRLVLDHLVLNRFFALPGLFLATAVLCVAHPRYALLALLSWLAALATCVLGVTDGHGAARVFANWLVLLLPLSAYGVAILLGSRLRLACFGGVVLLVYIAMQPLLHREPWSTGYLEILDHQRFRELVREPPAGVDRIIVPDDDLLWRSAHSTLELATKYRMILQAAASPLRLVSLTQLLEDGSGEQCDTGGCAFFAGLPCMDLDEYPFTSDQCRQLLGDYRTSLIRETTVVAAPFVRCSIYSGTRRREWCDPAMRPRTFAVYRVLGRRQ